jgi:uncharacterized protein YaaW (UPF0174 family)
MREDDFTAVSQGQLLPLLRNCSDDDLGVLVDYILKAISEELSGKAEYKQHAPRHSKYPHLIAEEIRLMGGNTVANVFRREGLPYAEVVADVCGQMGIKDVPNDVVEAEKKILMKIFADAWDKMSIDDRETFLAEVRSKAGEDGRDLSASVPIAAIMAQGGVRLAGFMAYRMANVVANAVASQVLGRGISLAANATLARTIGVFASPIGWVITVLWTAIDLAGPAYRVTIPCVIQIAYLRQKHLFAAVADEAIV